MIERTAGTRVKSSKHTAKPSRIALSNGGESASAGTSWRRMRCSESASATDSAGILSGRSFAPAADMTISRPRSMGSIFENFSRFGSLEDEVVAVDFHVYRPVVFQLQGESRTAPSYMNVPGLDRNPEFARLLSNIDPQLLGSLPVCHGELYFLPDKIIELKSGKIRRDILGC